MDEYHFGRLMHSTSVRFEKDLSRWACGHSIVAAMLDT
jgi:hypothetical protein